MGPVGSLSLLNTLCPPPAPRPAGPHFGSLFPLAQPLLTNPAPLENSCSLGGAGRGWGLLGLRGLRAVRRGEERCRCPWSRVRRTGPIPVWLGWLLSLPLVAALCLRRALGLLVPLSDALLSLGCSQSCSLCLCPWGGCGALAMSLPGCPRVSPSSALAQPPLLLVLPQAHQAQGDASSPAAVRSGGDCHPCPLPCPVLPALQSPPVPSPGCGV